MRADGASSLRIIDGSLLYGRVPKSHSAKVEPQQKSPVFPPGFSVVRIGS
jgi:hypothetical protein